MISEKFSRIAYQTCVPLSVTFEITLRCNIRCAHCYNFDRDVPYAETVRARELTPDEILRILREVREAGGLYLAFSGGEALVHPELDRFVRAAADLHFAVTVKSNGTLLTPDRVRRLTEAGGGNVEVSLYGAKAATHDAFVKVPGAFERTVQGIGTARDLGMPVRLSFSLVKGNAAEAAEMVALAERMGVACNLDPQITARYDGNPNSLAQRLDREELERLYRGPLRGMVPAPDFNPGRSVQCSCARTVAGISAFGEVYPCIGAPVPSGNLREKSFGEIWRTSPELNRIRGLTLEDFKVCQPCPDRPYCRRSSGVVVSNTGNYTGPEEFTCMEANVLRKVHEEAPAEGPSPAAGVLKRHSIL